MTMIRASLAAALLLLLLAPDQSESQEVPIIMKVWNYLMDQPPQTYRTQVKENSVLLGAMTGLMNSSEDFNFTYTISPNVGVWLNSVNGIAGNQEAHTFWKLLVEHQKNSGTLIPLDVGIGNYTLLAHDTIVFNFTTW